MAKSLAQQVAELPEEERLAVLAGLNPDDLLYDWSFWGRPEQIPPKDDSWDVGLFLAGRGCVAPWTQLYDQVTKTFSTVEDLAATSSPTSAETPLGPHTTDGPVYLKGQDHLWTVSLSDGSEITVTGQHRFLTPDGWQRLESLHVGQNLLSGGRVPLVPGSERREAWLQDAQRLKKTLVDSTTHCLICLHQCGQPLLQEAGLDQDASQQRIDVGEHNHSLTHQDGQTSSEECSRACLQPHLHARSDSSLDEPSQEVCQCRVKSLPGEHSPRPCRASQQSPELTSSCQPSPGASRCCSRTALPSSDGSAQFCSCRAALLRQPREYGGQTDNSYQTRCQCRAESTLQSHTDTASALRQPIPSPEPLCADESCCQKLQGAQQLQSEASLSLEDVEQALGQMSWVSIESIQYSHYGDYYDLTIAQVGCYYAEGVLNHNSGKTRSASEWVRDEAKDMSYGTPHRFLLVARTAADVREVMVEGEALALDTLVATPTGFTEIRHLKAGDPVLGGDGLPAQVTEAFPVLYDRPCFILDIEGTKVITDANHKWVTQALHESEESVKTTLELYQHTLVKNANIIHGPDDQPKRILSITPAESVPVRCIQVDSPDHTFLITPDLIRTHNSGILNVSPPSEKPEYKPSVRRLIWPNGATAFLTSADEPDSLRGVQARLALDTPLLTANRGWQTMGTVQPGDVLYDENGQHTTVTEVLPIIEDPICYRVHFENLTRSGKRTYIDADDGHRWATIRGNSLNAPFKNTWALDDPSRVTTLEIKNTLDQGHIIPSAGELWRVTEVEPIPQVPMRCIMVDGESHLYLAGRDLVATSNTRAWSDELAAWRQTPDGAGMTAWDNLRVATRLGKNPKVLATTTPKRVPTLFSLLDEAKTNSRIWITRGSTFDNMANLAGSYIDSITGLYEGTALAQQELYGEMLEAIDGALWKDEDFTRSDMPQLTPLRVVAVDPSVAENPKDECGIIVVGSTAEPDLYKRKAWVLEDASILGAPSVWAQQVVATARRWGAPVIAEVNQGGALVREAIHQIDPTIPVYEVFSKAGKKLRAEPVTLAYQQKRVFHVGDLSTLEEQLITWDPEHSKKSPDRLDALVHGLTALLIKPPKGMYAGKVRATSFADRRLNLGSGAAGRSAGRRSQRGGGGAGGFRVR